jgi:aminoglycoside phosphotransferase family enzyme/predicted kinase
MATVEAAAPPSGSALAAALARPEAYAEGPAAIEVRETHISWVFLTGDRAYKLKKPVRLPFVDYGTPARRRVMCDEEVRLNRRLAPDVYLGVRAVILTPDGVALAPADDPDAVDYMVEMRRFDEARTLASMISRHRVSGRDLEAVGRRLAEFHAAAAEPDGGGATAALHAALAENADTLLALAPDRDFARRAAALARFTEAFFTARRDELETRARSGHVRDGHGDLRAEHVLLTGGVVVVDCLEFDRALRVADVGCDLAFLTMDLEALGAQEAARSVLAGYRAAGGDPGEDELVAFFAAYRALVRAKVALTRADQSGDPAPSIADARTLLGLAERLAWRARRPGLVVVAGLSATGKSRLASLLADRSGLRHLNSDAVRKRLLDVAPEVRAGAAAYGASVNHRTYEELGRLARVELERAGGVLVDATFRHAADRAAFRTGLGDLRADTVVECRAPLPVRLERARRRLGDPTAVSDADPDVVSLQAEDGELGDGVPADRHLVVRTDRPAAQALDDLAALLDARLTRTAGHRARP